MPLQDLPEDVKHILEKYAAQLDVNVVSQFVQNILEAVLETVPEGGSKQAVPKAKVTDQLILACRFLSMAVCHVTNAVLPPGKVTCAVC